MELRFNSKKYIKRILDLPFYLIPSWKKPIVIYYHSVNNTNHKSHKIENFESQLKWLINNNYTFVRSDQLHQVKNNKKIICLTFDDGYLDNFEIVLPLLLKYNIKATFFIVSSWFSISRSKRHHSYDLDFMTKNHIKLLHEHGMEIGSHTHSHRQATDLFKDSKQDFIIDINKNKSILESIINDKVTSFAYPNGQKGSFNNHTNDILFNYFNDIFSTIHNTYYPCKRFNGRIEMSHLDDLIDFKAKLNGRRRYLFYFQNIINQSKRWYN